MPLRRHGENRKRWRYLGCYGEEVMLCAGRVQVGPFWQVFWAVLDRRDRNLHGRTRLRPFGGRAGVAFDGGRLQVSDGGIDADLRFDLDAVPAVEVVCPSGERSWAWTSKRAAIPARGTVTLPDRTLEVDALGVEDLSAGYHARHTNWHWSAGVGRSVDGRTVGWNLVTGINDPPSSSERGIWAGGEVSEPEPVEFEELDAIRFADGSRLEFSAEAERARDERAPGFRSEYVQPFGTFRGSLGGIELAEAFGVMERHSAVW